MNGCILKGTPFVVDMWKRPVYNEKVYFLTHMHADHTKGLTSSWTHKFYTSAINCALLKENIQLKDGVAIALELDEPHIIPLEDEKNDTITVTLINANHVPGSVMYLFQGSFGNILYCGDMRFYPEVFKHPILRGALQSTGIDQLYLDNTFCHPNYNFPSRKVASQQVLGIIEQHPNHVIKLGIRSLGKEDLLEEVAWKFNELIYVDQIKYKQLKTLKRPNVYTTDMAQSRIRAVSLNWINRKSHIKENEIKPTISIRLTALEFGVPPVERPFADIDGMFTVPYSDHSSWNELLSFVVGIKPRKIFPVVKDNRNNKQNYISVSLEGRDDMSVFDNYLSTSVKCYAPEDELFESSTSFKIVVDNYVPKNCAKQELTTKNRKRALKKGVFYTSYEDEDCNTAHQNDSSAGNEENVINNAKENDSSAGNEEIVINNAKEISKAAVQENIPIDCNLSADADVNLSCYSNNLNIADIDTHGTRHKSGSNEGCYISNVCSTTVNDDIITSAYNDSSHLIELMRREPEIKVDSLLSKVYSLGDSLEKINNYLTDLV